MPFINHMFKDSQTFHASQIDNVKRMCVGEVPKSHIKKNFPLDAHHLLNKWHKDSVKEWKEMINNHDI